MKCAWWLNSFFATWEIFENLENLKADASGINHKGGGKRVRIEHIMWFWPTFTMPTFSSVGPIDLQNKSSLIEFYFHAGILDLCFRYSLINLNNQALVTLFYLNNIGVRSWEGKMLCKVPPWLVVAESEILVRILKYAPGTQPLNCLCKWKDFILS